jgi:hypothetical protein
VRKIVAVSSFSTLVESLSEIKLVAKLLNNSHRFSRERNCDYNIVAAKKKGRKRSADSFPHSKRSLMKQIGVLLE